MTTEDFKRKLTAILSADVVGYSRLMGEDEEATVKTLETYKGVMSSLIKQHRGRVVDSPGDNLLAEFGSVVDAVQCAVSIQKELQTRNADLPENRRMEFRVGINLGDVIEEEDRIYGDGVNIAARLESLADPGGICISKTAFDYIENKLPFGYRFIGEQTVKNIAKPVGAYKVLMETRIIDGEEQKAKAPFWKRNAVLSLGIIVILAIAAILYWNFYPRGPSKKAPKTIAVLPFDDLSPEKDQEYFVDGLSEEILNFLCQISGLEVMGKISSFYFKGKNKKAQEIANELGVEYLLEGSVRKAGNALRITAQLLRGSDGFHLWSKTYDKEFKVEDMFSVQEDIATAVANELKVTLGVGKSLMQLGGTDNVEAYELYLIAKVLRDDPKTLNKAQESIDAAIALDPKFALAWALKAQTHLDFSVFGSSNPVSVELDAALNAVQRAIEIDPNSAEAHFVLGDYRMNRGNWVKAEQAFQKALELSTGQLSEFKNTIGFFYNGIGFFKKANKLFEEGLQNDPLDKDSRAYHILNSAFLGNMQKAEEEYKRGKELFGEQWISGNLFITMARLGTGHVGSRDEIVYHDPIWDASKEHLDSPEKGLSELRRLYTGDGLSSSNMIQIADWAAYFGDPEFAMDALEKGLDIQASGIFNIWYPSMHEVRQLPRFKKFVKEIGLVEYWNKFGWPDICHPLDNGDFECD